MSITPTICFNQGSSPSIKLSQQSSSALGSARSRPYQKQAIFNKPFGILNPSGCCPCNECCSCEPDYLDDEPVSPALPVPSLPGVPLRRYVRPNGAVVVEVEESPVATGRGGAAAGNSNSGSSLFGGSGLFSRFLPSAIESATNRTQKVDPKDSQITWFPSNSTQIPMVLISNQSTKLDSLEVSSNDTVLTNDEATSKVKS
uniref:Uncharacterized protein n=1 Tax=Tetranychus urticae TaxID=32264 RepID=T1KT16_TETUR